MEKRVVPFLFFLPVSGVTSSIQALECKKLQYLPLYNDRNPLTFRSSIALAEKVETAAACLKVKKSRLIRDLLNEGLERLASQGLVPG